MKQSDPGPLPKLEWLDKSLFVVDHHYQRFATSERSLRNIQNIADSFYWARFQPPTVMPGPKGKYLVIDGQHRVLAAAKRKDITKIPCYVIEALSREEAAAHFVAINKDRTSLTPLAIYRAKLAMGDPEALQVNNVCEEADISIAKHPAPHGMTKPRETAALGSIQQGLKKYGEAPVIAALMIVPDTYKLAPGMMRSAILRVLMQFFAQRGVDKINRDLLIEILKYNNPRDMEDQASMESRESGKPKLDCMFKQLSKDYDLLVKDKQAIKRRAGACD